MKVLISDLFHAEVCFNHCYLLSCYQYEPGPAVQSLLVILAIPQEEIYTLAHVNSQDTAQTVHAAQSEQCLCCLQFQILYRQTERPWCTSLSKMSVSDCLCDHLWFSSVQRVVIFSCCTSHRELQRWSCFDHICNSTVPDLSISPRLQ